MSIENRFTFKEITEDEMFEKITKIDPSKACKNDDVPPKVILGIADIISDPLKEMFNMAKESEKYPQPFKNADVTGLPKTRDKQNKKKYRPVSLTPIFSKIKRDYFQYQFECQRQPFRTHTNP